MNPVTPSDSYPTMYVAPDATYPTNFTGDDDVEGNLDIQLATALGECINSSNCFTYAY